MVRLRYFAALLALPALAGTAEAQNWQLQPGYGTGSVALGGGQVSVDLEAGGDRNASALGANCFGFVANAPDYRVMASGGPATLTFTVESGDDTTLVVRTPGGAFLCDDDSAGNFNPRVVASSASAGQYDIWVGTFAGGNYFPPARLTVASSGQGGPVVTPQPQPPVREARYFYAQDNQPVGPVTLADIQAAIEQGAIRRDTLMWEEGMPAWAPAESFAQVGDLFPPVPPPLPAPPPAPPPLPAPPAPPASGDDATEESTTPEPPASN